MMSGYRNKTKPFPRPFSISPFFSNQIFRGPQEENSFSPFGRLSGGGKRCWANVLVPRFVSLSHFEWLPSSKGRGNVWKNIYKYEEEEEGEEGEGEQEMEFLVLEDLLSPPKHSGWTVVANEYLKLH